MVVRRVISSCNKFFCRGGGNRNLGVGKENPEQHLHLKMHLLDSGLGFSFLACAAGPGNHSGSIVYVFTCCFITFFFSSLCSQPKAKTLLNPAASLASSVVAIQANLYENRVGNKSHGTAFGKIAEEEEE